MILPFSASGAGQWYPLLVLFWDVGMEQDGGDLTTDLASESVTVQSPTLPALWSFSVAAESPELVSLPRCKHNHRAPKQWGSLPGKDLLPCRVSLHLSFYEFEQSVLAGGCSENKQEGDHRTALFEDNDGHEPSKARTNEDGYQSDSGGLGHRSRSLGPFSHLCLLRL